MTTMLDTFKKKISAGEVVFGPFMKTTDPAFVEIAGYAGFDFVILDMEHGPVSYENLQNLIRGAIIAGTVPIVRTSDSNANSISKALDLGAMGVQIPQVQSAYEAKSCITASKFFPLGERGSCRFVRAADYSSVPSEDYFTMANNTLVILQLEGKKAIDNLNEILEVKGIDIIFIGPYDLSQSMGFPGQVDHPEVANAMKKIVDSARKRDIVLGTFTDTIESAKRWKAAGIQYISYSVDVGIFTEACSDIFKKLKVES
jgi:4-hydroxy-2-oxoheptanedioate aldolase